VLELGLHGKRALVAGAGPGLGRSCALALSEAGVTVACVDFDKERAMAVRDEIVQSDGRAIAVGADLRSASETDRAVKEIVEGLGGIDVVVDVIGEIRWGRVEDLSTEDWDYSVDGVLRHAFNLARSVAPQLRTNPEGGCIVTVSSVSGLASAPFHAPYGAAKAGLISLTRSLAVELAPDRIRVNNVCPGAIATPRVLERMTGSRQMTRPPASRAPLGRMGLPSEVATAVTFLASDLASYISGHVLVVDGGASAEYVMGALSAEHLPDNGSLEQPPPLRSTS
jgi:NAD(P)-dependent dehydrogenase (short-subunit alcohol dehydrogenase family)